MSDLPLFETLDSVEINCLKEKLVTQQKRIAELERELKNKKCHLVGYTNGNQIEYAKQDEGAFYPDTDNNCYVPLYMLDAHLHRLDGTASQDWMEEQEGDL